MNNIILPKEHLSLTTSTDIAQISEVLKPYGIVSFAYCRYFFNHSTYVLNSHAQSQDYHLKKGYIFCPQIPKDIKSNKFYCFPALDTSYGYIQAIQEHQSFFNLGNFIFLFEKFTDYFDVCLFTASPQNHGIINFYLNNMGLLENFKFYFKEKAKKIMINAEKSKIFVPEPMRPSTQSWESTNNENSHHEFLTKIEPRKYILNNNGKDCTITKNELAVLKYIALGNTVKETAKIINISPRTVESYLNNARQKLSIEKKTDIIHILLQNSLC